MPHRETRQPGVLPPAAPQPVRPPSSGEQGRGRPLRRGRGLRQLRRDWRRLSLRRRRRLARTIAVASTLALAAGYTTVTLAAPLPPATVVLDAPALVPPPPFTPAWPAGVAAAAGVVGHGSPLAGPDGQRPVPIASIAKLVTALVVLDAMPLEPGQDGPSFTIGEQDLRYLAEVIAADGFFAEVRAGQRLTQLELLQGMLVPSANNLALTLAQRAFGDNDGYVRAARAWLDRHGLPGVVVTEPSGIDEANTASAADLVRLGMLALQHPVIAETIAMDAITLPVAGRLRNTNQLLGQPGVLGIKTGHTDAAGYCFLLTQRIEAGGEPRTVVVAILGAPGLEARFALARQLAASAVAGFVPVSYVTAGAVLGTISTPWGGSSALLAQTGAAGVVWNGEAVSAHSSVDVRPPTAEAGMPVGTVSFDYAGTRQQVRVVTAEPLRAPDAWWRLTHPAALFAG